MACVAKKNIQYVVFPLDNFKLFGIFRLRRVTVRFKRALRLFFSLRKKFLSDKKRDVTPMALMGKTLNTER